MLSGEIFRKKLDNCFWVIIQIMILRKNVFNFVLPNGTLRKMCQNAEIYGSVKTRILAYFTQW